MSITTTNGEEFTREQSEDLAFMVWKRWGCNMAGAAAAWRRLMQNSCPDFDFEKLVQRAASRR